MELGEMTSIGCEVATKCDQCSPYFLFIEKDFAGKMKPCLHGPNPPCQVKAQPKVPTGAIKPDNETVKVLANLETDCFKKT